MTIFKTKYCLAFSLLANLLFAGQVLAQNATVYQPRGWFQADQAKLGEPVVYTLVFHHPSDLEVVFPDSAFDFSPFELLDRQYFLTRSDSTGSYDSTVYTLATYELDSLQLLALPAMLPTENGFQKLYPQSDTIRLVEVIEQIPEDKKFFEDSAMAHVAEEFNAPFFWFVVGVVIIGLVALALIFVKPLQRYFKKRKALRDMAKFHTSFGQLKVGKGRHELEEAVQLWKRYTGQLMNAPLSNYTTKEIARFIDNNQVVLALGHVDKAIYSTQMNEESFRGLEALEKFTQTKFEEYIKQIEHGFQGVAHPETPKHERFD